ISEPRCRYDVMLAVFMLAVLSVVIVVTLVGTKESIKGLDESQVSQPLTFSP
ncbi:hypothetical protein BgiMline_003475, partial [Biomphalaria glabrata]